MSDTEERSGKKTNKQQPAVKRPQSGVNTMNRYDPGARRYEASKSRYNNRTQAYNPAGGRGGAGGQDLRRKSAGTAPTAAPRQQTRTAGDEKTEKKTGSGRDPRIRVLVGAVMLLVLAIAAFLLLKKPDIVTTRVIIEAGDSIPDVQTWVTGKARNSDQAVMNTDLSQISTDVPGEYPISLTIGRFTYVSKLEIRDTVPPVGQVSDRTVMAGTRLEAADFVDAAEDITQVEISYGGFEPDFNFVGRQAVSVELKDAGGNITRLDANLEVITDTVAPVIEGVTDKEVEVGGTVSYKQGVSVTDDCDPDPKLEIDNSQVNLDAAGVYQVLYTATDAAGNRFSVTSFVTVKEKELGIENMDQLKMTARRVLDRIVDSSMSDVEQLNAMFWYVKKNMVFVSDSDKSSYINEAIRGFDEGYGDCFTFFAMMKALMEEAGFETFDVQRIDGETRHYWSLVKYNGEWYHIDACPRSEEHRKYWYCFLRTDSEMDYFANFVPGYYKFDKEKTPATATEKLSISSYQGSDKLTE